MTYCLDKDAMTDISFDHARLAPHAVKFLATFLRFEFALKEAGFGPENGDAQIEWGRVTKKLGVAFFLRIEESGKADTLMKKPPKKQITHNYALEWEQKAPPKTISDLFEAARRVRNNLVHGVAVGVHIAQTYGGMRPMSRLVRGGLAPWQERRAREVLLANIKRGVPLKEVARECGLSVGYFSHAFRRTLGVAPHKWLTEQRVELSKEKLRDDGLSLSDVAAECGFSDQSHLTRIFRQAVGVSPGAWRRALNNSIVVIRSVPKKSGSSNIELRPAIRPRA
jgi:AraC-like DNA-binding protein